MINKILLLSVFFAGLMTADTVSAQTTPFIAPQGYTGTTVNYLRTWDAVAPGQTPASLQSGPLTDVRQVTEYYDAFGRPLQTVIKQGSPQGNDMVTAHLYNAFGQEQYQFLPFVASALQSGDVANDGKFKSDGFVQQQAFYNTQLQGQPNELYANGQHGVNLGNLGNYNWSYQQNEYENSPQNRVLSSYAPGVNWAGTQGTPSPHNMQTQSLINTASDNVQRWSIGSAQGSIPTSSGAYPANTLAKSIGIDEQGHQVISFTDTYGQEILRKIQYTATADDGSGSDHPGWLCTYNVYDDNGNLRFIIPPSVVTQINGTWTISQTLADELCYRFEYDSRNRMVIKKMPGTASGSTGEEWMVYDFRNRLVMSQDGNLRAGLPSQPGSPQWTCYLYDALDRQIMTGIISSGNSLATMQQLVTNQTGGNTSGTLSGATPPTLQGNLTLDQPNTSGTWDAAQSIVLASGFNSATIFTAEIVPQAATPVNNTVVVNNNPIPSGLTLSPLTASFYDNYNWLSTAGTSLSAILNESNINGSYFNTSYYISPVYAAPIAQSNQTQGLSTGIMTSMLALPAQNLYALQIYDDRGRTIQTQATNSSGGTDITTNQFDWSGKSIHSLVMHTKSGANPQTHLVSTSVNYDAMGRPLSTTKSISSTVGGASVSTPVTTLATNQYNERNMLQQVVLGNNLETQQFDYNVRGMLLGMNRNFAQTAGTGSNYFGYDLGYDNGNIAATGTSIGNYAAPRFNGILAGTVWKSKGDNQIRKYDYGYDAVSRMTSADFNQFTGTVFDKTAGLDFSVSNGYDVNGNIGSMTQKGWILGGSQSIDQLAYHYINGTGNGNRLQYVEDNSPYNTSTPSSKLGDFHYSGTKTAASADYGYDHNANVSSDANRSITSIVYNYLNLPYLITFAGGKGTIEFDYDATGNKLSKITKENNASITYNGTAYPTSITTTTTYIGGFVYKSVSYSNMGLSPLQYTDKLQIMVHEQGRVRALYADASNPSTLTGYAFDYFIRDNVNNVRMVLTDEAWQDTYPAATIEADALGTEQNYYEIKNDAAHVVDMTQQAWWQNVSGIGYENNNSPFSNPGDNEASQTSKQMYKLNGATGDRFGLGITVKVMAGDKVSILGKSVWHSTGSTPSPYPLSSVMTGLLSAFAGTGPLAGGHLGVTGTTLNNTGATTSPLSFLLGHTQDQQNPTTAPKAAINWILFNEQFVPVSMGTELVSSTGDVVKPHSQMNLPMASSGYLYVFCSNESDIDVYFDNLQVVHTRGPLLQEDHYYPAGVQLAGISDRAWEKLGSAYHYQGKEKQDHEFSDGTGLDEYDFGARFYDPQLGRWQTHDPASQYVNPYLAMGNSWPNGVDPTGMGFWRGVEDIGIIAAVAVGSYFTAGAIVPGVAPWIVGGTVALGGYGAASIESHSLNPGAWDKDAWKAAITGELITESAFIGGEEIAGNLAATGANATWASQVAIGSANGIGQQIFTTEVGNLASKNQLLWSWDKMFQASVTSVISGTLGAANVSKWFDDELSISQKSIFKGVTASIVSTVATTGFKESDTKGWSLGHFFDGTTQWPALVGNVAGKAATLGLGAAKLDPWQNSKSPEGKVASYFFGKFGGGIVSQANSAIFGEKHIWHDLLANVFSGTFFWNQFTSGWYHFATSEDITKPAHSSTQH